MDNKEKFRGLAGKIERSGIHDLMAFIEKSDFFTAPASTRFHGAYEGGLLEHSLNVYEILQQKKSNDPIWAEKLGKLDDESILIVALFHDICKTYYYSTEMRNRKDESGRWVQVSFYTVDDRIPYGHGEKSVMMIEEYMRLKPVERYAIRWHMGPYSGTQDWQTYGNAIEKYPLALALFEADMEATHLMEVEK